jgi:dolichyl-phosphate beta-glucosyltransferase
MHIERYAFDVELFVLAGYLQVPVSEVSITWHEVDGSKMHLVQDSLNMATDLVLMRLGYTLGLWRWR